VKRIILLCLPLFIFACPVLTQLTDIPVEEQVPMLVKVLSFDKNAPLKKDDAVVGILYQHDRPVSNTVQHAIMSLRDSADVMLSNGTAVRFIPIALDATGRWKKKAREKNTVALIVTQVDDVFLPEISTFCREQRIISMTTVARYVEEGISLGVASSRGKKVLLVNLPVSLSEGAQFSSRVLQIAKILR